LWCGNFSGRRGWRDFFMNMTELVDLVESNPLFELFLTTSKAGGVEQKAVAIKHGESKLCTVIPLGVLGTITRQEMEDILTGKREPQVLIHRARIVGYYSRVDNWNLSKMAELRDRWKGKYKLPEPVPV
jgi:hypothetical protein